MNGDIDGDDVMDPVPRDGAAPLPWQYHSDPRHEPKHLPEAVHGIIRAMLYGMSGDIADGHQVIPAGTPITDPRTAARALGFRVGRLRRIAETKAFKDEWRKALEARRLAEEPRNLAIAIGIRDNAGDGSPERDRVRLKAIDSIRGPVKPVPVRVNVAQRTTIANQQFVPGYVVKLDSAPLPIRGAGGVELTDGSEEASEAR